MSISWAPYPEVMRLRPLGWEFTMFLVAFNVLAVGLAIGSESVVVASIVAMAAATPVVLLSLLIRLAVGIAAEQQRAKLVRSLDHAY